ncbi:MAG: hypothetical protein V4662_25480 [Verrucomicrobiota bacterium]
MKPDLFLLPVFLILGVLQALTGRASADDNIIQVDIFSMPKITAMRLMDDERIVTDPAAVLQAIDRLKSSRQASLVATQLLKGRLPLRTTNEGKIHVEVDAGRLEDEICYLNIALNTKPGSHSAVLVTATRIKLGAPKFLGTLEPPELKEKDQTWLVFLRLR